MLNLALLTVQDEEVKENTMGLATTDWVQSAAPSMPTGSLTPSPPPLDP